MNATAQKHDPWNGRPPAWEPNSPKQEDMLLSNVFEMLAWGGRGGGKSDFLLMDFLRGVHRGLGPSWRGMIIRREFKDLLDIVERSQKWFRPIGGARFRASADSLGWTFARGERLIFRHAKRTEDISQFLGQEWPWQGFDELCNWAEPDLYFDIQSSARSSDPRIKPRIRSATNPWGPGAWWVKERFIDKMKMWEVHSEDRTIEVLGVKETHKVNRTHVRIDFRDNPTLRNADPSYLARIAPTDPAKKAAWIEGRWDLSVGGFFSGVWSQEVHVIRPFKIPQGWRIDRAHDWGAASPHCTLWIAEASGERVEIEQGVFYSFPRGTLIVIAEIYGWNGKANEGRRDTDAIIAADIKAMDREVTKAHGIIVQPGPADTQIFDAPQGRAIIDTYRAPPSHVDFNPADKSPGSRVTGAKNVMDRMIASVPFGEGRPMEAPGVFIFSTCAHTIRTLPKLQRDEKKPDDVDTEGEDHAYDPLRYRCLSDRRIAGSHSW